MGRSRAIPNAADDDPSQRSVYIYLYRFGYVNMYLPFLMFLLSIIWLFSYTSFEFLV